MQEEFKSRWRRLVSNKLEAVTLGDFGFYDPAGIGDWADAYIRSDFNPGHLPRPGGLRGQTARDRADLATYMRGYAWAQFEQDEDERVNAIAQSDEMKDYTL